MTELSSFEIGQTVQLADGHIGIVQFVGDTHFAPGDWIGVVFDDAVGKNDGSVQGTRYFECVAGHGMFVRPAVATVLDQPTPKPGIRMNSKVHGTAAKDSPFTAGKRTSVTDVGSLKRQSINAGSPTPMARASRLTGSSKSPTKHLPSAATSASSSPRTTTPSTSSRKSIAPSTSAKRMSMAPPPPPKGANKAARPSIASTVNGSVTATKQTLSGLQRGPSSRLSVRPDGPQRPGSVSGDSISSAQSISDSRADNFEKRSASTAGDAEDAARISLPSPASHASDSNLASKGNSAPSRGKSPGPATQRFNSEAAASERVIEELNTRLRVIENQRSVDREKLKVLERTQEDRDRFEGIIQKLQSKYQPQQQELAALKRYVKEVEAKVETLEAQQAENDSLNEMATLDRETAEEIAESAKLELQALRRKTEELELEVEVLREENDELGKEISPEEKTSQGWLQLERSNTRAREALGLLRDVTQEQEAELKKRIGDLERELEQAAKVQADGISLNERLLLSQSTVEDLRQQLETALGAEEMIEELTERNLALNEKLEESRLTIEELESLKELNDELEINHTENERQLQDEIDYQESLLVEEARKQANQVSTMQDLEQTVSRFRELVFNMQSDLEDMRASQEISEAQANELNLRSRAMQDLNMKLQTSATKTQVKAVDLQLGKLEAQQSSEHLAIVQPFLPDSFQRESDSIHALLRLRRTRFKSVLLYDLIRERITHTPDLDQNDNTLAECDILNKLVWISSTCDRHDNAAQTYDLEAFQRMGSLGYELEPVERALTSWIESVKCGVFRAGPCMADLPRYIALMTHLAENNISESLEHYADSILARTTVMQSHLETTAIALLYLKSTGGFNGATKGADPDADDEDGTQTSSRFELFISQVRSAKVISNKTLRQLEELKSRHVTLDPSSSSVIEQSELSIFGLSSLVREVDISTLRSFTNGQNGTNPAQLVPAESPNWQALLSSIPPKIQAATSHLHTLNNLATGLSQAIEFPRSTISPPWIVLAHEMHVAAADLSARQTEMGRLKDEVADKTTALAMKEKSAEEMAVKLEVLEKRVGESGGRRERVRELEAIAETAKTREKTLQSQIAKLRGELQDLIADRDKWKQSSEAQPALLAQGQNGSSGVHSTSTSASLIHEIENMSSEIKSLQSAVRYLRSLTHAHDLAEGLDFLSTPINPAPSPASIIKNEASDVLREMLSLTKQYDDRAIRLRRMPKEDRIRWRPARDTNSWQIQRHKEEWAEWIEWRDNVAQKARHARRAQERKSADFLEGIYKGISYASPQMRSSLRKEADQFIEIPNSNG